MHISVFDFAKSIKCTIPEDKTNKQCFEKSMSIFQNKSAQLPHSVIFHFFSYLLHLEGCHRGDVCRVVLQEGLSGLQRNTLRLVLNSLVIIYLSCV